jgi:3-oxoacyl-(acyl-carrier-protein) synthase
MRPRPTRYHECASAVDLIADYFGLYGHSLAVATACSSGALAIAAAAEMIQTGEADVMLAGGTDSLSRTTWSGFHSLLLVDSAGCRPFDANRAGISLGEGAAVLVLEAEETARRRGAKMLARLAGWGASCDAHHTTAPHPEGAGAVAAMQSALRCAGLEPSAIDYVNAHGTGTRDNDLAESKALKTVFGGRVPPFSSTKRVFGHALAASGAIEAVVCVEALRRQELPPNPGFSAPDPAIGLEPITALRRAPLTHVMSNSFGFGGNNAALIFSTPETPPRTRATLPASVAITGLGIVGPGPAGVRKIEPPLPPGKVLAHICGPFSDAASLSSSQRRRLSRMTQMALVAARRSHAPEPSHRLAVAMGTGFGCLDEGAVFIENLIAKDEREPMPTRFSGSVHNAPAAQIAIDLRAHGLNSAPTAGEISFECALWQGMCQLAAGESDCALVGAVDELNKYPLAIGKRWGLWNEQTRPGEGAVVARLSRAEGSPLLARVTAVRLGRYRRPFDSAREADWIAAAVDLSEVDVLLSGAKGWPVLEEYLQIELRRRLSRGLSVSGSYQLATQTDTSYVSHRYGYVTGPSADNNVRHAVKFQWDWSVPVGRGRRYGTNLNAVLDGIVGGWEFNGAGRVQARMVDFGNVRLVGMSVKDLQKDYFFRINNDPANAGRKLVTMLSDEIILNTRRAYNVSATSATGYSDLGVPEGRYIAPANSATCIQLRAGDCAPRTMLVQAPWFTRIDISLTKKFVPQHRLNFELKFDVINLFDNINFNPVANPGSGATIFQATSAYTDLNNTFDPGGRLGQITWRVNW